MTAAINLDTDIARIEAALFTIPPDIEREQWWKVGAALKSELGDSGFDLFDRWSQSGGNYNAVDARDTWKSTKAGGGIGLATLFGIAKSHGFDPAKHKTARIDPAELERRREARARRDEAERAKVEAEQRTAAALAIGIWDKAEPANDEHPYLVRKKVRAHNLRIYRGPLTIADMPCDGCLIVPVRDGSNGLLSLEFIRADGAKRFLPNGRKAGGYHPIGRPGDTVGVAEGYATAASVHEATGYPVAVAFDAGNLLAVSQTMRGKFPDARMIVCADDDHQTKSNPGRTKAEEAAQAVGGVVAIPDFGPDRPDGATDWNDLHNLDGLDAVREAVEAALSTTPVPGDADPQGDCTDETALGTVDDRATPPTTPIASREDTPSPPADGTETDDQAIARLAALKPMEYDRLRKTEAKRMGIQVTTLDKAVIGARESEDDDGVPFSDVEPWSEPVDGAALLDDIAATVRRFIVCNPETVHGATLWVAMTWLMDSVDVAPIAAITAPEKRCGKSQLLFLFARLSARPLAASNITPAALFRAIEAWRPTLLIDEADAFMRENEELRGLLNCGHTRDSAYVVRTVGDDHMPKQFFVWGAKAIAGIGHLADTLMDRSIALELRRKLPHESVDKLRHAEPGMFDRIKAKLARWSDDNESVIRTARPLIPDALHDRAADNWEPLLQIADIAGGHWPDRARAAALKLSGQEEQAQSAGAELLSDIKEAFTKLNVSRLSMADLLSALLADDEAPWKTWNRGREMTARQLGKKLGEYGVKSKVVRIGYQSPKGFDIDQFRDAFDRYLSPLANTPLPSVTRSHLNNDGGFDVTEARSRDRTENLRSTLKPPPDKGCDYVTDGNGNSQGKSFSEIEGNQTSPDADSDLRGEI
ncbi:putative DNA primase/helicase [Robbsia andropogonis]|uniref:DUF3631 domain-containing protein n=1 Tax=Robbsia andropogonis TaxID=28092 RepID=UPI003D1C6B24